MVADGCQLHTVNLRDGAALYCSILTRRSHLFTKTATIQKDTHAKSMKVAANGQ